ncbi:TFIIH/NER complex subunit [Kickxella alabastrina]|nr:TFIIH/NER complex subunit [Kickxella alabastrina]
MSVLHAAKKQDIPEFFSKDDTCPECRSERYLNQSMKLLVSPCYHELCEACVHRTFEAGPAPCPVCHRILRMNEYYQRIFEDLTVENEVRIRARMAMTYNKREGDFKSLKDYNDYLEMVEDLVVRQLYGDDTGEVEYVIEKYKRENNSLIEKNQSKQQREENLHSLYAKEERLRKQKQREEYLKILEEEERERKDAKNSVIDALATSNKDAREIVRANAVKLKKSSLSHRNATRKAHMDIEALLRNATDDSDDDSMGQNEADAWVVDPEESPYEPMNIELRDKYEDIILRTRLSSLSGTGVTREMHQRYVIEGAMAGLFEPPLTDDNSGNKDTKS